MASNLITASSPTGINLRPLQAPRTEARVTVGPLDMNPAWQANAAAFQSLQLQENKYQFDQEVKLKMAEEQRKLFQGGVAGLRNSQGMRDENYGLVKTFGRKLAIAQYDVIAACVSGLYGTFVVSALRLGKSSE